MGEADEEDLLKAFFAEVSEVERDNEVLGFLAGGDLMKTGKKGKKGGIQTPKLKTEDPNKSYVQRPVKRG